MSPVKFIARAGCVAYVLCAFGMVSAQEPETPPPTGPAQIIQRAGEARDQARMAQSPAQTPEAPLPAASPASPTPSAGHDPHTGVAGAPPLDRLPMQTAQESPELRAGTIRVRVLNAVDQPVANARVQVGVMQSMGGRTTLDATTDEAGVAMLAGLSVGDGQAYRVNVLHDGAKYSSNPFRLPVDHGYDVMVRQLDTTRSDAEIVLYIGATSIELHDERIKVIQQSRLVNVGQRTYVFPDEGQVIPLPAGFLAFQAQDTMSDQQVTPLEGKGLRITGSLAPGQVTLTWAFDLPRSGSEASFSIPIPWRTYAYRVLADAADGMRLDVEGMPAAEPYEHDGHRLLVTEIRATAEQPRLAQVSVRLTGIPGPGPARWIALGIALFIALLGTLLAFRRPATTIAPAGDADDRARGLAQAIAELDREHAAGEVGPQFHTQERARLLDELAALLRQRALASKSR